MDLDLAVSNLSDGTVDVLRFGIEAPSAFVVASRLDTALL
jgi:hypothetical protein